MTLPRDITRCHDRYCAERHQCRRWLERDSGWSHAQSLNPYALDSSDACELRVPVQP